MELNTTDRLILAKLQEGRAKPSYLARELGKQQPYISNRLSHLVENGVVIRLYRGLYGLKELEGTRVDAEQLVEQATDEELVVGSIGRVLAANKKGDRGEIDSEFAETDDENKWDKILYGKPYDPMEDTQS
jgi:DNA-binding Lrp family transcriptional regulator